MRYSISIICQSSELTPVYRIAGFGSGSGVWLVKASVGIVEEMFIHCFACGEWKIPLECTARNEEAARNIFLVMFTC